MTPGQMKFFAGIAFVLLLVGGGAYFSWTYRSAMAEKEVREAVESSVLKKVEEIGKKLDEEREKRALAQEAADKKLAEVQSSLDAIRAVRGQTQVLIARDREANKPFYDQPLPEEGRKAWIQARQQAVFAPEPASSSPQR